MYGDGAHREAPNSNSKKKMIVVLIHTETAAYITAAVSVVNSLVSSGCLLFLVNVVNTFQEAIECIHKQVHYYVCVCINVCTIIE